MVIPTVYDSACPTVKSRLLPLALPLVERGFRFTFLVTDPEPSSPHPGVEFEPYCGYAALVKRVLSLRRGEVDVVFPSKPYSISGLLSLLVARCRDIGFVLDVDDRIFPSEINKWWRLPLYVQEWLSERLMMGLQPSTVVASRGLADRWGDRCSYIPNSADLDFFSRTLWRRDFIAEKTGLVSPVIVWPAVFFQETDRVYVLEIFRELQMSGSPVTLLVLGDGEYLSEICRRAESLDLRNVSFAGRVPYGDIPHYYASAQAGIIPLRNNGYDDCKGPIKLFEYMAMELPVIATDIGEPKETIRKADCGILVPFDDAPAAARMITNLVSRPDEMVRLGVNGRLFLEKAQSFTLLSRQLAEVLEGQIKK